ncbi:MAG TPA: ComEC/Rec2 family competence protein [Candidatus Paceibacterota bacterium]
MTLAIFFLTCTLGMARYEWRDQTPETLGVEEVRTPSVGQGVLEATIIDEPEETESSMRYRVRTDGGIKMLLIARQVPVYDYGDKVSLSGKVERMVDFTTKDGEVVAWQDYWARDEIYYESVYPVITLISKDNGNWLQARLYQFKHAFLGVLSRQIPEPEASLAGGLDLGAKQSLGKALLDKFRTAGLIHMVVLSGYNITIVALGVMWLFRRFLSLRASIGMGVLSILLFAIMVGGGSTVLRASVMAVLGLLAQATGRVNAVTRALIIAALVMVAWNPKVLVFDTGFQLSFLATLGLICLEPIFAPWFRKWPEKILWMDFRPIASATLGAQLAVLPLILYTFGNFSLYAFPVNMLVLPIVPTTMLFIFLCGFAGLIALFFPPLLLLAYPLAWLSYFLLSYMIGLVSVVSHLPLASLTISHIPILLVFLMYASLIFIVLRKRKTAPRGGAVS